MPKPIRVVVGETERLLRDIVQRTIELQADMELVGGTAEDSAEADVAIVVETPERRGKMPEPLVANPRIKVIVLTNGGRGAHVVELCEHPVADVSPQGLVNAIRAAVTRTAGRD